MRLLSDNPQEFCLDSWGLCNSYWAPDDQRHSATSLQSVGNGSVQVLGATLNVKYRRNGQIIKDFTKNFTMTQVNGKVYFSGAIADDFAYFAESKKTFTVTLQKDGENPIELVLVDTAWETPFNGPYVPEGYPLVPADSSVAVSRFNESKNLYWLNVYKGGIAQGGGTGWSYQSKVIAECSEGTYESTEAQSEAGPYTLSDLPTNFTITTKLYNVAYQDSRDSFTLADIISSYTVSVDI